MNAPAELTIRDRETFVDARRQLLATTRQRLDIDLPRLAPDVLASDDELGELRRIATAGRAARIRVILRDAEAALRDGHRLIALAQRLSSLIEVRTPVEDDDRASASACLLNDAGGYLWLPEAERAQGRAAAGDRAAQAPLLRQFEARWERCVRASILQPLDL
jgi:hypothetical protein